MQRKGWMVLLLLGGSLTGCGVRGNPRPPLPDVRPPVTAPAAPDAGH